MVARKGEPSSGGGLMGRDGDDERGGEPRQGKKGG